MPFGLTFNMFLSTIENLGAPDQIEEWAPQIRGLKIVGAYAQTELGHGSFVPGIQTLATFDKSTQEFVIHTPSITAIKFWPGDLGKHSNFAIVFARMMVDGKLMGVHPFMVQTRNLDTWETLPGIECGDIGPKFGYNTKDNGYMIFNNVRIPRKNMMRRFVELDEEGQMSIKGDLRAIYGIMLETRVWIAGDAPLNLSKGLTIATRYAAVRRQFPTIESGNKLERKLIDYQTHMFKLAPLIAAIYVMNTAARYQFQMHLNLIKDLDNNEFGGLDLMHHMTSGFKACFSRIAYDGLDTCRVACGGAGFSAHSGLPSLQVDYSPNTTYEGDNTVMLQQTARLLMKTWKKIKSGKEKPTGLLSYINNIDTLLQSKSEIRTVDDALSLANLDKALAVRSAYKIKTTNEKIAQKTKEGVPENDRVHSELAIDIVSMAQSHIMYLAFQIFISNIENPETFKCPNNRSNMQDLARVFALNELSNDSVANYETGHFQMGTHSILLDAQKKIMNKVRPQMIPLIEAWGIPDSYLVSAIGNSYGDIYE